MTIHEQITALLNGDLADDAGIGELMQVLAVSPEKRTLLLEQIRMSRAFGTMGAGVTPPQAADRNIWSGIAAIDNQFGAPQGGAPAAVPIAVPEGGIPLSTAPSRFRSTMLGVVFGLLLLGAGLGMGYLLWNGDNASSVVVQASERGTSDLRALAAMRDSLGMAKRELGALAGRHQSALLAVDSLSRISARERVVYRDRIVHLPVSDTATASSPSQSDEKPDETSSPSIHTAKLRSASPDLPPARHDGIASRASSTEPIESDELFDDTRPPGPWQVGLRDLFRLSLPRVYGLSDSRSIFFDKELYMSYRLGSNQDALAAFKIAAAVGETQFSQVYHTNTGGQTADTIIEQSPTLHYGRVMVAPELITMRGFTGALELGAGGTMADGRLFGPVATFGFNLEYRPVDMVALHAGASWWVLWTEFLNQAHISTNLNGHIGFAVGF